LKTRLWNIVFFSFAKDPIVTAETITHESIALLKKNGADSPFFMWIHYMDLHEPYYFWNKEAEREYSREVSRSSQLLLNHLWQKTVETKDRKKENPLTSHNIQDIKNIYDDKIRDIDNNLKEFFDFLDDERLLEHTLAIVTSDHGQEFLDHGYVGHGTGNLYDEVLHIPFILNGLEVEKINNNGELVSQLDIAPTILDFFGVNIPESYRGNSLFSSKRSSAVLSAGFPKQGPFYSIRTAKWKFIWSKKGFEELYNLERDPIEKENLTKIEEKKASSFKRLIEKHIEWEEKTKREKRNQYEKEKIRERIRKIKTYTPNQN
jgi:arylsulfatase A-like enzyme